jgi:riboflavin synthase
MFTGIILSIGEIAAIEDQGDRKFFIASDLEVGKISMGASIACNGICLTVVSKSGNLFAVQASRETLDVSTAKDWQVGTKLNLEPALRVGYELGGHLVLGHVDGMARVTDIQKDGESLRFAFDIPESFARFVAAKGSIAIDGVSLTVNEVEKASFHVNIIPYTQSHTCFGHYKVGDNVNFEIDVTARYLARMLEGR